MRLASIAALMAVLFAAAPVTAQTSEDQQARALFDAGRTAYEAGRFEQALRYFRESYDLSHRPALLFNIASAADRLLLIDEAIEAYRGYLDAVPDAENRELALARIEFLESRRGASPPPPPADTTRTPDDDPTRDRPAGGGDVTGEWWFWTLIAVLGVGAIVGISAGVAVATSTVEEPLPGTISVSFALEGL